MIAETITIRFEDDTGLPLARLYVIVELVPTRKNSYFIHMLTDTCGGGVLSRAGLLDVISHTNSHFPMDYSGTLENIETVKVIVDDARTLLLRVPAIKIWDSVEAARFEDTVRGSTNSTIEPNRFVVNIDELDGRVFQIKLRQGSEV